MNKVKIIAEIGPNHNGKVSLAKKLVLSAKKSGADYVKFQTFITEDVITPNVRKANYQIKNTQSNETQFEMLKKLQLSYNQFKVIKTFCDKKKIKFLSTAFDLKSLKFINSLKPDYIKIPSGEINNLPLLRAIANLKKKTILSTGMCSMKEVVNTIRLLKKYGLDKNKITLLHCNSEYPTPLKDVNLKVITTYKNFFKVKVGYSDHTLSQKVPIAAVVLGSSIIEKHFTLSNKYKGPDHKMSFNPKKFSKMVKNIRETEILLGKDKKVVTSSESKNRKLVRRSIVAIKKINVGEKFTIKNLGVKRPGYGKSPLQYFNILGKYSKKNYKQNDLI